jgi:ABC-type uncharacterized transport system ATPase component
LSKAKCYTKDNKNTKNLYPKLDNKSVWRYTNGIVNNKEIQMFQVTHYGMFTEYGNRVIDGVVIAAKALGWSPVEVRDIMDDISTVRGLHEASDTAVREMVYNAVFG